MTDTNIEAQLRKHRCCFTGHRPGKLQVSEKEAKQLLHKAICDAIKDGYVTFISGMAAGIDVWAATAVLGEKRHNPNVRLICAVPFEGFELRRKTYEQNLYRDILKDADLVRYICPCYSPSCFQTRNVWMCDRSSRVIAAYNGIPGGTRNTIVYAEKQGIEVVNIFVS